MSATCKYCTVILQLSSFPDHSTHGSISQKTNKSPNGIKTRAANYCHNYRGISFLCTGNKILTIVLNNILKKYTDHIIGEYYAGLKTGKSTMDIIFTVKNLLVKALEYNVEICQSSLTFRVPTTVHEEANYKK